MHDYDSPYFLTAYDIAVKWGFKGTEKDWLDSLTAYAMAQQAGYVGTVADWLADLIDPVPEIQIGEVATLEGGSMATASISGDKRKPLLNLGIPRGVGMADALPLVGGTMRGGVDMDGNQLHGLPEPIQDSGAVPKSYADRMLPLDGSKPMQSQLNMNGFEVIGLPEPTREDSAVPKSYVLPKSGGAMTGNLLMGNSRVRQVGEPLEDGDSANKKYVDEKFQSVSVTLTAAGWENNLQTVGVSGVTADKTKSDIFASPDTEDDNYAAYNDNGVRLYAQLDDAVTFKCDDIPSVDLTVSVFVRT